MSAPHGIVRVGKYPVETLPTRKKWPARPREITLAGGRIRIIEKPNPRIRSPYSARMWKVLGYWDPGERVIVLKADMDPAQMWATLLHEITHAALYDTAAHLGLKQHQEEQVCEALGLAYMHQLRFLSRLLR